VTIKEFEDPFCKNLTFFQVPINEHNYVIRMWSKAKCADAKGQFEKDLRLVYIVKSAMENFEQRKVIR